MSPMMSRIGNFLASDLQGYLFGSGKCTGCRVRKCAYKESRTCRSTNSRIYSLEATGVLVTDLMKQAFNIELQWWRPREPEVIPDYMIKVIGLTIDKPFDALDAREALLRSLNPLSLF